MSQKKEYPIIKGRGVQSSSFQNKFNNQQYSPDQQLSDAELAEANAGAKTTYLKVYPKTLVNAVPSKDIYLNWSMNPYQGCEHGCTYCYARTTHEYWGYGPGLDFEQNVLYKPDAPKLLREFLMKKSWHGDVIMLSGNTDCYQPAERKFKITRQLLEVMHEFRNPVGIITKNSLLERDMDILVEMAKDNLVQVNLSITTLDDRLRSQLEPRTSTGRNRLKTMERLSAAGVPVHIMIGPVIPGLNSHEIPEILKQSSAAGAQWANYIMVRLNGVIGDIFTEWLEKWYPDRKNKVLNLIKESNGGVLSNTIDGGRMRGKGQGAQMVRDLFEINRKKYFPSRPDFEFNTTLFSTPGQQLNLF